MSAVASMTFISSLYFNRRCPGVCRDCLISELAIMNRIFGDYFRIGRSLGHKRRVINIWAALPSSGSYGCSEALFTETASANFV